MSHYHYGHNTPGYLPESEPGYATSFRAAARAVAEDRARHADEDHDAGRRPIIVGSIYRTGIGFLEHAGEPYDLGRVYWVETCEEDCEEEL